ncbi:MAG: hypothetical protein AAGE05_01940 [Pseudomonadota bacterium]
MAYTFNTSSQLMPNHIPGTQVPEPEPNQMRMVADKNGAPIIFTLERPSSLTGPLTIYQRDPNSLSGWQRTYRLNEYLPFVDAGHGPAIPQIEYFDVFQDATGSITIAYICFAMGQPGDKFLFVSDPIPAPDPSEEWMTEFNMRWQQLPKIDRFGYLGITVGMPSSACQSPLVIVRGQNFLSPTHEQQHRIVNTDPRDKSWTSKAVPMPQDATDCYDARPGYLKKYGAGIYSVCGHDEVETLSFVPLSRLLTEAVPPPDKPVIVELWRAGKYRNATLTMEVLARGEDGETDIFLAGNGYRATDPSAWWFSAAAQQAPLPAHYETIAMGSDMLNVTDLSVRANAETGEIVLWAIAEQDQFFVTRRWKDPASGQMEWQVPMPIEAGISAFATATAPNLTDSTFFNMIATGHVDGQIALKVQDPQSRLWRDEQVSTQTNDNVVDVNSFTTRVVVEGPNGAPAQNLESPGKGLPVQITASFNCTARINGVYRHLHTDAPIMAETGPGGDLTIIYESTHLEAPIYSFAIDGQAPHDENPGTRLRETLEQYKSADNIENATRSDGSRVFAPGTLNGGAAAAAAGGIGQLLDVHDALPKDHRLAAQTPVTFDTAAPRRVLFAVRQEADGTFQYFDGDAPGAAALVTDVESWRDIFLSVGDFFAAVGHVIKKVTHFVAEVADGVTRFVVYVAGKALSFAFKVASEVFSAVNFVLKKTLGLDLSGIVKWLGFIFDWQGVLDTKRAFGKMVELGKGYAESQIGVLQTLIDQKSAELLHYLDGADKKMPIDTSNPEARQALQYAPADKPDHYGQAAQPSPQTGWMNDHLSSSTGHLANPPHLDPGNLIVSIVQEVGSEFDQVKGFWTQKIQPIIDGYDTKDGSPSNKPVLGLLQDIWIEIEKEIVTVGAEIAKSLLNFVKALLDKFWTLAAYHIEIPVITYLYENVIVNDGSKLSLLDVTLLLGAFPTSVFYRAVAGEAIFSSALVEKIESATTFENLMTVLESEPARNAVGIEGMAGTNVTLNPKQKAVIGLNSFVAFFRLGSLWLYIEGIPASLGKADGLLFKRIRYGVDAFSSLLSFTSWAIVMSLDDGDDDKPSGAGLAGASVLAVAMYRLLKVPLIFEPLPTAQADYKLIYTTAEAFAGLVSMGCGIAAAATDLSSGPPPALTDPGSKAAWEGDRVLVILRETVNGVYRILAPAEAYLSGDPQIFIVATRTGCKSVSVGLKVVRVGLEWHYKFIGTPD